MPSEKSRAFLLGDEAVAKAHHQSGDRSRIRFMYVEVDGSSGDLQQVVQTIANAVRPPQPVMIQSPATPALPGAVPTPPPVTRQPSNGHFVETDEAAVTATLQEAAERTTAKPSGAKKKFRTPKNLFDLDFTSGDKALRDFFDEHAPKKESMRYLIITQWLKLYRGITEVGADHIYTCYRFLGMNTPQDVLSPFRGLKKQAWVEDGQKAGFYRITHTGENQLNQPKP